MIDYQSTTPLYLQLYQSFKEGIIRGEWASDAKLPSIRACSAKYNLSKTTVEKAYNQLTIEGFIETRPQSGTYVLPIKKHHEMTKKRREPYFEEFVYRNTKQPKSTFDFSELKRALHDVIHNHQDTLNSPPKPTGEPKLKHVIMHYLHQERSVKGHPSQVVIGAGMQTHLTTIANLIHKRRVGFLEPLFHHAKTIFSLLNFTLIPCKTLDDLLEMDLDFIYISPSNLYPSGGVIPFNDRMRLIDYAKTHHAYIIEDDYNYVYRHNAYQIPSIQSLSHDERVIYIGSFSRQLLPSFRLSYMVLPPHLIKTLTKHPPLTQTVSILDQLTIATYMARGGYQKLLKKLSTFSKKQNDRMRNLLKPLDNNNVINIFGLNSNLHVLWQSNDQKILCLLIHAFTKNQWSYTKIDAWPNTLLLPYSGFIDDDFSHLNALIETLNNALNQS